MYALPALTMHSADLVAAQFRYSDEGEPEPLVPERRPVWRWRAGLADALARAAGAVAPAGYRVAHQ